MIWLYLKLWTTGFFTQFFTMKNVKVAAIVGSAIGISSASILKQQDDKLIAHSDKIERWIDSHEKTNLIIRAAYDKRHEISEQRVVLIGDQVNFLYQEKIKEKSPARK